MNKRTPMIVCKKLPEQERVNTEMLKAQGCGLKFQSNKQLIAILSDLIENRQKVAQMSKNTEKIRKPEAMKDFLKMVELAPTVKFENAQVDFSKVNQKVKKMLKQKA